MKLVFSQLLHEYIHKKDINVYSMAQFCGTDRSNMYKFINGERKPPSLELVRKMAAFMQLTSVECDAFIEAYNIASVGAKKYFHRKAIVSLLNNFENYIFQEPSPNRNSDFILPPQKKEITVLKSQAKLLQHIFDILSLESKRANAHIRLLMPPNFPAVLEFLVSLGYHYQNLQINHIFPLNNTSSFIDSEHPYNLECLSKILPLYVCGCTYNSYYYYKDSPSGGSLLSLFPYLIVTSEYTIIFSETLMQGILIHNRDSVELYQSIFQKCMASVLPLATKISDVSSQLSYLLTTNLKAKNVFMFEPIPCMTYFMPNYFLEKYIYKEIASHTSLTETIHAFFSRTKEIFKTSMVNFIFTEQGIKNFLETGRIEEYPSEIYSPFVMKDRIYLIRHFINVCSSSQIYMLKDDSFVSQSSIYIYATPHNGYLMIPVTNPNSEYSQIFLDLSEPELLSDFYDFCNYLKEDYCYSYTETINRLNKLLLEYQKQE